MSYVRDQFRGHREQMNEWSTGADEDAIIERPPEPGVISNRISIRGEFRPSDGVDDNITATGITSRLNGFFFVREDFIPEELGEYTRTGTREMEPGWTLHVRGVRMRVARMVLEAGELTILLSDLLERYGDPY